MLTEFLTRHSVPLAADSAPGVCPPLYHLHQSRGVYTEERGRTELRNHDRALHIGSELALRDGTASHFPVFVDREPCDIRIVRSFGVDRFDSGSFHTNS